MVQTRRRLTRVTAAPVTKTSSDTRLKSTSSKRKKAAPVDQSDQSENVLVTKKPARKMRKKTNQEPSTEDFPVRVSSPWKIGAHVSAAGGVENAVRNAAMVGANAFALFVKSQRKWDSPPLSAENIEAFKRRMQEFGYSSKHVLPHGSYLVNLGNPDEEKRKKSFNCFLDDLQRCEELGLELYNFHPGSTVGQVTKEESIALIAECINNAHNVTKHITIVIENMAGSGNVIGSQFSELKAIIDDVEDKTRVGVCLDTCHMFAAVRALRAELQIFIVCQVHRFLIICLNHAVSEFDSQVGLSYLKGLHLNDSKAALGSRKDRHENIGLGQLVSDSRIQDLPLILETPTFEATEIWMKEISALNCLSKLVDDSEVSEAELSLVNDITSLVRSRATNKVGKASKSKTRARKRDVVEEQEHDSDCD
ncbi:xylose isomerase-like protein [Suillus paluster]|uniref:xylose isomerase-like protein n=1 Tax=Suillus paluster TaxID=48578 RepID=UPI001B8683B0|nr:xylose isomerase-like protein [Suillus paluster]KAG1725718.1 xylose isomerase-like protein [Suillus paluster]